MAKMYLDNASIHVLTDEDMNINKPYVISGFDVSNIHGESSEIESILLGTFNSELKAEYINFTKSVVEPLYKLTFKIKKHHRKSIHSYSKNTRKYKYHYGKKGKTK